MDDGLTDYIDSLCVWDNVLGLWGQCRLVQNEAQRVACPVNCASLLADLASILSFLGGLPLLCVAEVRAPQLGTGMQTRQKARRGAVRNQNLKEDGLARWVKRWLNKIDS